MSLNSLDVNDADVGQIRRMRDEVHAYNKCTESSYGPLSHALKTIPNFSRSWTAEHPYRFQVVAIDDKSHITMFPAQYVVLEDDKTLNAIREDGLFLTTNETLADRVLSTKLYSGFFMDLLQLATHGESVEVDATSVPMTESSHSSPQLRQKETITQAINHAKRLNPPSNPIQVLSHSLIHNFLKYVATMEHLAYPDMPFWCPRYGDITVFSDLIVRILNFSPLKRLAHASLVPMTGPYIRGSDVQISC
jgi:hypothetical protein